MRHAQRRSRLRGRRVRAACAVPRRERTSGCIARAPRPRPTPRRCARPHPTAETSWMRAPSPCAPSANTAERARSSIATGATRSCRTRASQWLREAPSPVRSSGTGVWAPTPSRSTLSPLARRSCPPPLPTLLRPAIPTTLLRRAPRPPAALLPYNGKAPLARPCPRSSAPRSPPAPTRAQPGTPLPERLRVRLSADGRLANPERPSASASFKRRGRTWQSPSARDADSVRVHSGARAVLRESCNAELRAPRAARAARPPIPATTGTKLRARPRASAPRSRTCCDARAAENARSSARGGRGKSRALAMRTAPRFWRSGRTTAGVRAAALMQIRVRGLARRARGRRGRTLRGVVGKRTGGWGAGTSNQSEGTRAAFGCATCGARLVKATDTKSRTPTVDCAASQRGDGPIERGVSARNGVAIRKSFLLQSTTKHRLEQKTDRGGATHLGCRVPR
ncbi:hypothetical protein B0H15DRAFT_145391 [Mycena belliarum]|uniref:Uncharacterized protein n=1 Tax=Mycena belliarum TaxID=1033014 RepID=A0AAD6UDL3_9AGAR|nr:hypothetical protein B0H15DRAFT_145391 [Mycena belliae]